jgi:Ca2+-transporting ATPase
MAFVTFVFFQAFNLLNVRDDTRSVFNRETLRNHTAFVATAAVVALLVLIVQADVLHGYFTTTDLTSGQWLACAAIGSAHPVGRRAGQDRSTRASEQRRQRRQDG